ncbi:MAG TPA: zinc-ribbon domain-containing protein [Candidatus Bathyarchaeia archaeon]|nr:zinc-ribbon domain-containing protein [Candidatus Bathyarchaeia archaeon]
MTKTLLTKRHRIPNGDFIMVYCPKCGTQNEDTAEFCAKCGANLQTGTPTSRRYERRRAEAECFGLPHGGAIVGIAIGLIVLLWGISMLAQQAGWIPETLDFWVVIIIIVGILMIAGAVYRMTRQRTNP